MDVSTGRAAAGLLALLAGSAYCPADLRHAEHLPDGFALETVIGTGLVEPTVIEFLPDGRLLIGQRDGVIRVAQDGVLRPTPLISIPANVQYGERGLVGLTLDPDFDANGYFYVYYTTQEPRNRVGRFTLVGDGASLASEVLIWQNPELADQYHHGGTIRFGPDDHLYIATGDQFDSGTARDMSREHGKMLRVTASGAIPADNPFVGVPGVRPAIWASGLRNPFRFVFDPLDGRMLIGNVGGNLEDSWEELNVGLPGADYGWPQQEGPLCFSGDCGSITYPIWSFAHNDPAYFEDQVQGSVIAGALYRGGNFPAAYQGNLFVGDYANRWIRRLVFDPAGEVIADPVFLAAPDAGTIVDLEVGPDGALYFVTIGVPWSGSPDTATVYRIRYLDTANAAPIAVAAAGPTEGGPPLVVNCSSAGSVDPDDGPDPLTYLWTVSDGRTSTLPNPSFAFNQKGPFTITLQVSDGELSEASDPIPVWVGTRPVATIATPAPGTTYAAGDTIQFSGAAVDGSGAAMPASALTWRVVLVHAAHVHPFFGPTSGVSSGSIVIPSTGHAPQNTHYSIELTATDADGLVSPAAGRAILPQISAIRFATDPPGIPIFLDGEALTTPADYDSLVGFRHQAEAQGVFQLGGQNYNFDCWSDGGARVHEYIAPPNGGVLTAVYAASGGDSCPCDLPGDLDRDGNVDLDDLLISLGNFGTATNAGSASGDADGDGDVDLDDLLLVLGGFGQSCRGS